MQTTIILGRNIEKTALKGLMSSGMNLIEADADVEPFWVAGLSDEQIDSPMHTTWSAEELQKYAGPANFMATISRSVIKGLIAVEGNRVYARRTQAEVQTQKEKTVVNILQLGNSSAWNGIKTTFARFLKTVVIELFRRGLWKTLYRNT